MLAPLLTVPGGGGERDGLHCYADDDDEANLSFLACVCSFVLPCLFVLGRGEEKVRGGREHMAREREEKKRTRMTMPDPTLCSPRLRFPGGLRKMRWESGEGDDSRKVGVAGGDRLSACWSQAVIAVYVCIIVYAIRSSIQDSPFLSVGRAKR